MDPLFFTIDFELGLIENAIRLLLQLTPFPLL
jgi:hypothetical protein